MVTCPKCLGAGSLVQLGRIRECDFCSGDGDVNREDAEHYLANKRKGY